jgi:hypothetical protein
MSKFEAVWSKAEATTDPTLRWVEAEVGKITDEITPPKDCCEPEFLIEPFSPPSFGFWKMRVSWIYLILFISLLFTFLDTTALSSLKLGLSTGGFLINFLSDFSYLSLSSSFFCSLD